MIRSIKVFSIFMVVGALSAQNKPKAAAPVPEKSTAVTTAPAAIPATDKKADAPVTANVSPPPAKAAQTFLFPDAKLSISAYGGLSLSAAKSTHASAFESYASNSGITQKVQTGWPTFGGGVWYGNQQMGLGLEAGYAGNYKNTSDTAGISYTYQIALVGIQAFYRYTIFEGLFVAAGAGVALPQVSTSNSAYVTTSLKTSVAPMFSLRVGYDYPVTPNLSIGGFAQFSYAIMSVEDSLGSGKQSYASNAFLVQPVVQVSYTF